MAGFDAVVDVGASLPCHLQSTALACSLLCEVVGVYRSLPLHTMLLSSMCDQVSERALQG